MPLRPGGVAIATIVSEVENAICRDWWLVTGGW
jgi:hypothetical protein